MRRTCRENRAHVHDTNAKILQVAKPLFEAFEVATVDLATVALAVLLARLVPLHRECPLGKLVHGKFPARDRTCETVREHLVHDRALKPLRGLRAAREIREIVGVGDIVIGDPRGRKPLVHRLPIFATRYEEAIPRHGIAREKLGLKPVSGTVGIAPCARDEPGLSIHQLAQNNRRILYRIGNPHAKWNGRVEPRGPGGDPNARVVVEGFVRQKHG